MLRRKNREIKGERTTRLLDVVMSSDDRIDGVRVRVKCNGQDWVGRLETIKETREKVPKVCLDSYIRSRCLEINIFLSILCV